MASITDHYDGYTAVAVRTTIGEAILRDLVEAAWRRLERRRELAEAEIDRIRGRLAIWLAPWLADSGGAQFLFQ